MDNSGPVRPTHPDGDNPESGTGQRDAGLLGAKLWTPDLETDPGGSETSPLSQVGSVFLLLCSFSSVGVGLILFHPAPSLVVSPLADTVSPCVLTRMRQFLLRRVGLILFLHFIDLLNMKNSNKM